MATGDRRREAMNRKALDKFSDDVRGLDLGRERVILYCHKRSPLGWGTEGATACLVLTEGHVAAALDIDPAKAPLAKATLETRTRAAKRVRLSLLRANLGRVHWRDAWTPRGRSVLGGEVFDAVLIARALACVKGDPMVSVEVGRNDELSVGILRIVGPGWTALVAGRREADKVPALALSRRAA